MMEMTTMCDCCRLKACGLAGVVARLKSQENETEVSYCKRTSVFRK